MKVKEGVKSSCHFLHLSFKKFMTRKDKTVEGVRLEGAMSVN